MPISAVSYTRRTGGFTLIELLVSMAIGSILLMGLATVSAMISDSLLVSHHRHQLTRDAQFAMEQMVRAVAGSRHLLLPLADNPNTNWPEHLREQTLPASPPVGDSTLATAVLAVTLAADIDLNADGIADADNDADGLIDEDLNADQTADNAPGIVFIDDDGDGDVDETSGSGNQDDDDEDGLADEDWLNGIDDDADGTIDEDASADMNNDADDGIDGVDDDGDGQVDESGSANDDEDAQTDEEYYDAVVFYLDNGTLMQRIPVPWDESGDSVVNGLDYITAPLAENVTHFRVERISPGAGLVKLVDLLIELSHPQTAETVTLHTRVRLGRAL